MRMKSALNTGFIIGLLAISFWSFHLPHKNKDSHPMAHIRFHKFEPVIDPMEETLEESVERQVVSPTIPFDSHQILGRFPGSLDHTLPEGIRKSHPQKLARLNPEDRFLDSPLVGTLTLFEKENGIKKDIKIVDSDFKYPLVRIEEQFLIKNGNEHSVKKTFMVGDHVLVQLKKNQTTENLKTALSELSELKAKIRKKMPLSGLILVEFNGKNPGNMETLLAALDQNIDLVEYAEPDYLVFNPPK